jgi:putative polyhydroxyalkanoate system protein
MSNLTITIPHQLGRVEAKRRVSEQTNQLQSQHAGLFERFEQRWDGDTLHFHVTAAGQAVSGSALFTEQTVHLEVALPWMLSMLAGVVKKQIEQRGRHLLGHRTGEKRS